MKRPVEVHAYLAGPDVFYPDAVEIGKKKKAQLAAVGITGHFPFDNEVSADVLADGKTAMRAIGSANEKMMRDCCEGDRICIILANMTPFHGPSMDVGTAFEVGFMSALAQVGKNVVIIGYTNDPRSFETRVIDDHYGGSQSIIKRGGQLFGEDGMMIEAFGGADNLMIINAIAKTGGHVVASFEEAVALAKTLSDQIIRTI